MGGRPRPAGHGRLCGHGVFAGGGGCDPRGAPGDQRRLCFRGPAGQRAVSAGGGSGQRGGVCPGAAVRPGAGGDLLPPGEAGEAEIPAKLPQAGRPVLADIHRAGHPQGPAVLLRRADGPVLGQVAAAVHRGASALGADLHHRRQRPGGEGLSVCHPGFRRDPGGVRRWAADLPGRLPAA